MLIYYDKKTYHSNCFIDKQVSSFAPKEFKNSKTMPKNDQLLEYCIDVQNIKMVEGIFLMEKIK